MAEILINDLTYKLVKNHNDGFDLEELTNKATDYFNNFDYIFGDWAYGKLRLKGFNDSSNKKCSKINDIANLDDYIENFCAYGCKWFLIQKDKATKEN